MVLFHLHYKGHSPVLILCTCFFHLGSHFFSCYYYTRPGIKYHVLAFIANCLEFYYWPCSHLMCFSLTLGLCLRKHSYLLCRPVSGLYMCTTSLCCFHVLRHVFSCCILLPC